MNSKNSLPIIKLGDSILLTEIFLQNYELLYFRKSEYCT